MLRTLYRLSILLAALMLGQSALGLLFHDQYRDIAWIKATWFGNDLVTPRFAPTLLWADEFLATEEQIEVLYSTGQSVRFADGRLDAGTTQHILERDEAVQEIRVLVQAENLSG